MKIYWIYTSWIGSCVSGIGVAGKGSVFSCCPSRLANSLVTSSLYLDCFISIPSQCMGGIAPPFVLQVYVLGGLERSELPVFVYEHDSLLLDVNFHVQESIIVHVFKAQGDGR